MISYKRISRGICIEKNNLLLCKSINENYYFLIGGRIEKNETSFEALKREIFEEMGEISKINNLKYCVFNIYFKNYTINIELNYIYSFQLDSKIKNENLSIEKHIEIYWFSMDTFDKIKLKPKRLKKIVNEIYRESIC